jgi:hypothetical protein
MPSAMSLGRDNRIARRYGSLLDPWGDRPAFAWLESYSRHRSLRGSENRLGPTRVATRSPSTPSAFRPSPSLTAIARPIRTSFMWWSGLSLVPMAWQWTSRSFLTIPAPLRRMVSGASLAPGRGDSVVDGLMQREQRRFLQSGTSACARGRRAGFLIVRLLFDGRAFSMEIGQAERTGGSVSSPASPYCARRLVLMFAQQMDSTFLVMQYVR